MSVPTGGSGSLNRFAARTGEVPKVSPDELYTGDGCRTGSLPKVNLSDLTADGTWYDHHNVPPIYRGLSVGEGDQRMTVSDTSVECVLNALDPDQSLRDAEAIEPGLVAWLAVPVQFEERPMFGFKRATVSLVEVSSLTELHAGLGAELAEMQGEKKPPRTADYLKGIHGAYKSNGDSPVDKGGPGASGKSGNGNPFRKGMTTLEFQKRFGGHRMYGAVNSLWKPGQIIEADDRSGLWAGVCHFAANGLASVRTLMSPTWEVSMITYQPMVMKI